MCVRNEKENGARIADGEAKIKKKKKVHSDTAREFSEAHRSSGSRGPCRDRNPDP